MASFDYYRGSRTHLGRDKQCPSLRQASTIGRILHSRSWAVFIIVMDTLHRNYMRTQPWQMTLLPGGSQFNNFCKES